MITTSANFFFFYLASGSCVLVHIYNNSREYGFATPSKIHLNVLVTIKSINNISKYITYFESVIYFSEKKINDNYKLLGTRPR